MTVELLRVCMHMWPPVYSLLVNFIKSVILLTTIHSKQKSLPEFSLKWKNLAARHFPIMIYGDPSFPVVSIIIMGEADIMSTF